MGHSASGAGPLIGNQGGLDAIGQMWSKGAFIDANGDVIVSGTISKVVAGSGNTATACRWIVRYLVASNEWECLNAPIVAGNTQYDNMMMSNQRTVGGTIQTANGDIYVFGNTVAYNYNGNCVWTKANWKLPGGSTPSAGNWHNMFDVDACGVPNTGASIPDIGNSNFAINIWGAAMVNLGGTLGSKLVVNGRYYYDGDRNWGQIPGAWWVGSSWCKWNYVVTSGGSDTLYCLVDSAFVGFGASGNPADYANLLWKYSAATSSYARVGTNGPGDSGNSGWAYGDDAATGDGMIFVSWHNSYGSAPYLKMLDGTACPPGIAMYTFVSDSWACLFGLWRDNTQPVTLAYVPLQGGGVLYAGTIGTFRLDTSTGTNVGRIAAYDTAAGVWHPLQDPMAQTSLGLDSGYPGRMTTYVAPNHYTVYVLPVASSGYTAGTFTSGNAISWTVPLGTASATATATSSGTRSGTATASRSSTVTSTASSTASKSGTNTASATSSATPSGTASGSGTGSATATVTPSPTSTLSGTGSATVSARASSSATATASGSASAAASRSATASASGTASGTTTPTASGSASASLSAAASSSASASASGTASQTASASSTGSTTGSASATASWATHSASASGSATGSATASGSGTGSASASASVSPTASATASASTTGSPSSTASPSGSGTCSSTATASPSVTPEVRVLTLLITVPGGPGDVFTADANGVGSQLRWTLINLTHVPPAAVSLVGATTAWGEGGGDAIVQNTTVFVPRGSRANQLGNPDTTSGGAAAVALDVAAPSMYDTACNASRAYTRGAAGPRVPLSTTIEVGVNVNGILTRDGMDAGDAIALQLAGTLADPVATNETFGPWLAGAWAPCTNATVFATTNGTGSPLRFVIAYAGGAELFGVTDLDSLYPPPVVPKTGLSTGVIVAVILAGFVVAAGAAACCWFCLPCCGRRRRKKKEAARASAKAYLHGPDMTVLAVVSAADAGPGTGSGGGFTGGPAKAAAGDEQSFDVTNPMRRAPRGVDEASAGVPPASATDPAPRELRGVDAHDEPAFSVSNPMRRHAAATPRPAQAAARTDAQASVPGWIRVSTERPAALADMVAPAAAAAPASAEAAAAGVPVHTVCGAGASAQLSTAAGRSVFGPQPIAGSGSAIGMAEAFAASRRCDAVPLGPFA